MKLDNAKLGDKYYGIIYKYSFNFVKAVRIIEFEVVKVNEKIVGISFNKETREYPQLFKKNKDFNTIGLDKVKLAEDYLNEFISWEDHSGFCGTKKIIRYLKLFIKKNKPQII